MRFLFHCNPEIFADFNDATVEHFIKLVDSKLKFYSGLIRDHKYLQALLELNVQNDDEFEVLSDKYKNLLHNKQTIEDTFKKESSNLDRLIGIVTGCYIDWNKFKGINVKHKLEKLTEALNDYKTESLLELFNVSVEHKSANKSEA
jgi:Bardet-Biedl syndrome 7 protein